MKALFNCRLIKVKVNEASVRRKALWFRNQNTAKVLSGTVTNTPKVSYVCPKKPLKWWKIIEIFLSVAFCWFFCLFILYFLKNFQISFCCFLQTPVWSLAARLLHNTGLRLENRITEKKCKAVEESGWRKMESQQCTWWVRAAAWCDPICLGSE